MRICGVANCGEDAVYRIVANDEMTGLVNDYCEKHTVRGLKAAFEVTQAYRLTVEHIKGMDNVIPFVSPTGKPGEPRQVRMESDKNNYQLPNGKFDGEQLLLANFSDVDKVMSENVSDELEETNQGLMKSRLVVRASTARRVMWQEAYKLWVAY